MQSRKASNSKKTSKNTNEAIVNEKNVAAAEPTAKPRASRSSKKKEVSSEAPSPSAKSHRKSAIGVATIPASESSLVANTLPAAESSVTANAVPVAESSLTASTLPEVTIAPKTMSAAAGMEAPVFSESIVTDPVGIVAAPENGSGPQYSREDVAKLAYSYWIARGYSHGGSEEDWLRAEAELAGKR